MAKRYYLGGAISTMSAQQWKQFQYTKDPDKIITKIIGRRFQEYRSRWKKASQLRCFQKYPIHLDFELHYGCNLRCPQCILQVDRRELQPHHPYSASRKPGRISLEKFKEIIDEGVANGLSSITLTVNNEPLMLPNLIDYAAYAKQKGVLDIIIITNGELLTEKLSKQIIESGVTKLYFSVDAANEETYKKIRKNGDFKTVVNNIAAFHSIRKKMKKQLPVTRVSFVKSKINEHEEKQFIEFWAKRADFISIQAFTSPAIGYSNEQPLMQEYHIDNKDLKELGPCPQPYQRLTIYHDGSVHPCCHWSGATLIVGNIHTDSIYAIWNSKRMKSLRKEINSRSASPQECRLCRQAVFGKQ